MDIEVSCDRISQVKVAHAFSSFSSPLHLNTYLLLLFCR